MAKINMTIRIEPELKERATELFGSLGLDISTATGLYFRQALRCRGLPFEVKEVIPNADTKEHEIMHGPFLSVSACMEALNA